jgi:hypothetical protein
MASIEVLRAEARSFEGEWRAMEQAVIDSGHRKPARAISRRFAELARTLASPAAERPGIGATVCTLRAMLLIVQIRVCIVYLLVVCR